MRTIGAGRYELEAEIASGAIGTVWRARDTRTGDRVAVKLLNPELAKDAAFVARFEKEAAALAALSHPNIVSIVDKGKSETTYFLVMEFVEGPSLREQVRSPLMNPKEALRMMVEICRARAAQVEALGFDETFRRVWDFYLSYSEAGFRARYLDVHQFVLAKGQR